LRKEAPATVYVAYSQLTGDFPTTVTVRATGALGQVSSAIQQTLQTRLGGPVAVRALSAQVDGTLVQEQMMATLASAFGLLALVLACVGLYGLLAYGVAQRTREIGIRMALGARGARVVALVLGRGTLLVLIGIALGLPAAWAASRWVKTMLFGLTPLDPVAIGGAIVLLVAAAQLAGYIPARRAARVDPLVALRHE
jgi:putative ABC transport system permease protein